jgi:predicted kinase
MTTLTLHYTYGLPGSGKTTFARDFIKKSKRPITRVNRDDLRMMLYGSYWGKGVNEDVVTLVQHGIIKDALAREHDVFCDDTNLSPRAQNGLLARAREYKAEFVRHDLSDVPPWTCIENDGKRDRQVGAKVIWDMWERYLKPEHPGNPALPHAVLVDVDGTLAIKGDRSPFDWHKVGVDTVNQMVAHAVELFGKDYHILIVSGRDGVCRPETEKWLADNQIRYDALYMRTAGDTRKDFIVKLELLEQIKRDYFPALCIDDRQQVVDAYRHVGLPVWQVARGDF